MSKPKTYIDRDGRALPYPWLINAMLWLVGGSQTLRLKFWSRKPRHAAEKTLRDILTLSRDTVYGKEHHFDRILSATTADDLFRLYRLYVPVNDSFETLRPYVERHKHGEENVLFPGKPEMYATTSGTTAEPKWIPMTRKYLKDVYGKMSHIWAWNFVKHRNRIFGGHIFTTVGKECEGYAPDGTLYGSVSGVLVRDIPPVIKKHYTAPASVMSIPDYGARNYTLMRLALQHRDVTLWATANPSTILELLRTLEENTEEMLRDIELGTICEDFEIPFAIRDELDAYISPKPERAAELRNILAEKGKLDPRDFWPWLQYLSTWKCGNTKIYMDKYMDRFDWNQTFYQELGYIATECRFGFALDDTNESVLFPQFHYYEFVEESELDSPRKHFLQIDELELGKRYCAYVTTYSGLYRYNMNDLVEVGGRYKNTPTVHMVSKVNGIVSMTGEKLYEPQFLEAVHEAEQETGIKTKFFVGFADVEGSKYHFYYEFENPKIKQAEAEAFTRVVDAKLQHINVEYESKRQSFRLHDPETHILLSNAYARFKAACLKDGFRDGQFKFNLLMQDEKRRTRFNLIQRLESGFERIGENIIRRAGKIDDWRSGRESRKNNGQQPIANSQPPTANGQRPTANSQRPKPIQTVIFDVDGTLYDKRGLAQRMVRVLWWCLPLLMAERQARKTMHQVQFVSRESFFDVFFARMAKGHWWSAAVARKWYEQVYIPVMVQQIAKYHTPRRETLLLINDCRRRGLKMGIYSDYGGVVEKLEVLGIDPKQFALIVDAPSLGALKPAKESAQKVLDRLGADPETTLFVGDRDDKDGASARAVGARFLLIN